MKINQLNRLLFCGGFLLLTLNLHSELKIGASTCENKINPTGVNVQELRFGWEIISDDKNVRQTAYQIGMASSPENLRAEKFDIYNSKKTNSENNISVPFNNTLLESAKTYYWKVRVWDNFGKVSAWSESQQFITGLFTKSDWKNAQWIGYEEMQDSMYLTKGIHFYSKKKNTKLDQNYFKTPVLPQFRKEFSVQKHIKKAYLFVTGLGQYEASLNGTKIGNSFLSPGWTLYDKRVLYNTYDITQDLQEGKNTLGMMLGNGFFNISRERYYKFFSSWGNPKMICRLKIEYKDGTEENMVSDTSWKTTPSPITFSNVYGGESYDAQLEQVGWKKNNFNDTNWKTAINVKSREGMLAPEIDYPVQLLDSFPVKKVWLASQGKYMYDFGQNLSGTFRLKVKGKRGQMIKLIPAELLDSVGLFRQNERENQPHYYTYTLKSNDVETWQPQFTYFGFRYIQVEGAVPATVETQTDLPVILNLTSLHSRNSNPAVGTFECSNQLFNRIHTLIKWAIKSNMQSYLTDCPHREKLSWLEQNYLMGNSIHYNFDINNLYNKLLDDMNDSQHEDGLVPSISPEYVTFGGAFTSSPEWGSASVVMAWQVYKWYGNKNVLLKNYPMLKKYVEYLKNQSNNHIISFGLGDWFDLGPKKLGKAQLTPIPVTATAIYYYDAVLLARMAEVLDSKEEVVYYQKLASEIKTSFNREFFKPKTNEYSTGSQTSMAMPLCVGLVDEQNRKSVLNNLVDSLKKNNNALTAGDIGFHFLVQALDEGGASKTLFDMINRDDVPGYGYQLKKGATSLTESWAALEDESNNHLMLGHIMEWFYSGILGISQEENSIGFKQIKIRPQGIGDLTSAKGIFLCPYGLITTDWQKSANSFSIKIQIPVNTTANVYLPLTNTSKVFKNGVQISDYLKNDNSAVILVGSGIYTFEVKN
ncbi:MAG: family 78 glycoside hydrolase catalytic domain [Bacteroidota bacterium]